MSHKFKEYPVLREVKYYQCEECELIVMQDWEDRLVISVRNKNIQETLHYVEEITCTEVTIQEIIE